MNSSPLKMVQVCTVLLAFLIACKKDTPAPVIESCDPCLGEGRPSLSQDTVRLDTTFSIDGSELWRNHVEYPKGVHLISFNKWVRWEKNWSDPEMIVAELKLHGDTSVIFEGGGSFNSIIYIGNGNHSYNYNCYWPLLLNDDSSDTYSGEAYCIEKIKNQRGLDLINDLGVNLSFDWTEESKEAKSREWFREHLDSVRVHLSVYQ